MDTSKKSNSDKPASRRRLTAPLSSYVDIRRDLMVLNRDIRRYRALYFSIATYVGIFTLLQFGFIRYLRNVTGITNLVDPTIVMINVVIFYLPWVFKPIFGYISDLYYPFFRRFKGYAIILGTLSVVITIFNAVYPTRMSLWVEISTAFFRIVALVWVDSLAQGMIAVSLRFEDRKEEIDVRSQASDEFEVRSPDSVTDMTMGLFRKPFQATYKYANSFGYFTAWVTLVRGVFEFIAAFMFDLRNINPDDPDNLDDYLQSVYFLALPFMMIMVLCFIFIPELKLQTLYSKRKPGSIFKFLKRISPANPWAMLSVAILIVMNPSNSDNVFMGSVMRYNFFDGSSKDLNIIYLSPVIAAILLVGVITLCISFCRFNRANLYLFLQIIFQLLNQGANIFLWSENRPVVVSSVPVSIAMFTVSYLAALSTISLPLLAVVENSIHKVPEGHEAFAVNLMSGLIFLGWMVSETFSNLLKSFFNIQQYAYDQLNYYTAVTLAYTLGTMILFGYVYSRSLLTPGSASPRKAQTISTRGSDHMATPTVTQTENYEMDGRLLIEETQ